MFDLDFAKLVHAMWHDESSWRDLDNQIRTMNTRLAAWRKSHKQYGGATHWLTQRTAFEVMVTMQTIYGLIERPRAIAAAVEPPPRPEPQPVVGEREGLLALQDGTVEAGMLYFTDDPIIATSDDTGVEVIHVSAAA